MQSSQCNVNSNACDSRLWIIDWCGVSNATSLLQQRNLRGRSPSKQAACLCSESWQAWERQQRRSIQKQHCSQGLGCLRLMFGMREGQENTKSLMLRRTPTDGNLSSWVCLSKYVEANNGKREFCTSQTWSYKRLSSYGLACGSWLYELSGTRPWFEGCIVSFQSETSQLHTFPLFEVLFTIPLSN